MKLLIQTPISESCINFHNNIKEKDKKQMIDFIYDTVSADNPLKVQYCGKTILMSAEMVKSSVFTFDED